MKERFGAKNPRSWMLRTHAQTAGVSLMAQQPMNNVVRTTMQALAAVLGGTQSLHTNSFDETYALPTEEAATLALRTQQVIAEESGVTQVADPLGGSYFVEKLTDQMEEAAMAYIEKIDEHRRHRARRRGRLSAARDRQLGVSVPAPGRHAGSAASSASTSTSTGTDGDKIPTLKIEHEVERAQIEHVKKLKASRDRAAAERAIDAVKRAAAGDENLVEAVLAAVKADVTVGEVSDVFRQVWGEHRDPAYL